LDFLVGFADPIFGFGYGWRLSKFIVRLEPWFEFESIKFVVFFASWRLCVEV